MIIPDINLLVYAYSTDAPSHPQARKWWEQTLSDRVPVGIPWAVITGFVRLMTSTSVFEHPLTPEQALGAVRRWLERSQVEILNPGPRHLDILESLLSEIRVAANLTTDAHLAAMAIEHQGEIHSNDRDFARFRGLRWRNPLG
ncbi:MAG: type II toxin-antitoxin system VapC family toxin [Deltaproteobacteria bacterium]|nr:type II toxin-antitoxin system VapC family toxin [Deltaproteobacteria bacterium]